MYFSYICKGRLYVVFFITIEFNLNFIQSVVCTCTCNRLCIRYMSSVKSYYLLLGMVTYGFFIVCFVHGCNDIVYNSLCDYLVSLCLSLPVFNKCT